MEIVESVTLTAGATDQWLGIGRIPGPGTFVFIVACSLADNETLSARVFIHGDSYLYAVVEDVTGGAAMLSAGAQAGFQSAPVPVVDDTWGASLMVKHDSATSHDFEVRVIKL